VNAQEEQLAASLANVEAAKAQITKTILTAPFDGVIARQDVEIGETVQANVPVITLISSNSFKVETFVSEIDVNKIQVGDAAEITLDDQPNKIFSAKITAIDPAESLVGNVSNYKVTLNFSENIENLRSGVNANISVISKEKDGVLVVPQNAVFEESGKKYVYVLKNGLKLKTEVQAGILGKDNLIEIVSGLQEGDKLLVPSK
jgi:HlyD family secretion protein